MSKGGRRQHAVVLQHPPDLPQGLLRVGHNVQRVGHDHHIERSVRIGQAEHILHRKVQLGRIVFPPCLGDHRRGCIGGLDAARRAYQLFCQLPGSGRQLKHGFVLHHRPQPLGQLLIGGRIPAQEAVVVLCVLIPEIFTFLRFYHPFLRSCIGARCCLSVRLRNFIGVLCNLRIC